MIAALAGSARFACPGKRRSGRSFRSTQHEEIQSGKAAVALVKGDQPGMALDGQRGEECVGPERMGWRTGTGP